MPQVIDKEKRIVQQMIDLYCRQHHAQKPRCADCQELLDYARARLDRCRYGEAKPSCKRCPTHCYKAEMRDRIRKVMRYAGPRMLFYHPLSALTHWF